MGALPGVLLYAHRVEASGDDSRLLLWYAVLLASLIAVSFVVVRRSVGQGLPLRRGVVNRVIVPSAFATGTASVIASIDWQQRATGASVIASIDWQLLLWLVVSSVPVVTLAIIWPTQTRFGLAFSKTETFWGAAALVVGVVTAVIAGTPPVKRAGSVSLATSLATSLEPAGERDSGRRLLRGTVSVENAGDTDLVLLGGTYLVLGFDTSVPPSVDVATLPRGFWEEQAKAGKAYLVTQGLLLDRAGRPDDWGEAVIAAGTKRQLGLVTYVPQGEAKWGSKWYMSTVVLAVARADTLRPPTPEVVTYDGTERTVRITETSWVDTLVRDNQSIYVIYSPRYRHWQDSKVPGSPRRVQSPWPDVVPCVAKVSDVQCAKLRDAVPRNEDVAKELKEAASRNDTYGINLFPAWAVS